LIALTGDSKWEIINRLANKVGDRTSIIFTHSRTMRVEDPDDSGADSMRPVVSHS
jgi:hypothetical protein